MTRNEVINPYKQGYEAYHNNIEYCPYSYDNEWEFWSRWCDGYDDAYCEDKGK